MEKILGQDQYDQSGFLVGPSTDEDIDKEARQIEILRAIHGDTQETVDQLGRIADGLGQLSVAPAPAAPAARVVSESGGDESRSSTLHAAPAEPTAGDAGRGQSYQQHKGTDATPAKTVQAQPDLSAGATVNVQLPISSAPAPAASSTVNERPRLPPTGKPAIADPDVAAAEKSSRESKGQSQERQANGRFGSGQAGQASAGTDDSGSQGKSSEALAAASESLKNAARGVADGADNLDPSVQAAKEVGAVVSPILGVFKPLAGMFGFKRSTPEEKRHRTDVMWYRRIWGAVRDKKSDSRMGMILTGLVAAISMLLAPIKALARMTGIMRALAAAGGLMRAAGGLMGRRGQRGAGGRAGRAGAGRPRAGSGRAEPLSRSRHSRTADVRADKVAASRSVPGKPGAPPESRPGRGSTVSTKGAEPTKSAGSTKNTKGTESTKAPKESPAKAGGYGGAAKGLVRKLPWIGALFGLGAIATTAMAQEDPGASPEERQQAKTERFGTYGSVVGGVVGGALGMFGGPAGAIAGSMLGEQLGESVGAWLATVDLGGMVEGVTSAFLGLAKSTADQASKAFDYVRGKWDGLVATGTTALTGMADWAKESWTAATERVAAARDTVADGYSSAKQAVADGATSVKDAGQNALNTITRGRYTGGSNARKDELIKAMDAGGITDAKSKAAFMANVDHESGGFTRTEENLNYSAKRLQQVFPKYYENVEQARADEGNPEAIANRVYGGRMGNTEAGDGFKYRGRGDIQLTGKAQYEAMGRKLGVDLVNNPELASDPKYSAQIAVQHWKESGANASAARGDITGARRRTNGGTNGMKDVSAKYEKYLVQAQSGDLTPTRRADQVQVAPPAAAAGAIASTMAKVKGQGASVPGVVGVSATRSPGPVPIAALPGQKPAEGVGPGVPAAGAPGQPAPAKPLGMISIASMQTAPATPAPAAAGAPGVIEAPKLATAAPAPLVLAPPPSYSAPAAPASSMKVPSTPSVTKPLLGAGKSAPPPAAPLILTQDLEDRGIAHAVTGGLGGRSIARM